MSIDFPHLMRCFGRLKCWSGCWWRCFLALGMCPSTAALLTCVVAGCAARLASSGPWMEAQVSRWVGESDSPLNHCLYHSTVPLPVPHHCVPSQHTTILYHRMPCTKSIYQHLSSTLITPGVSLSFVWDVRCRTWKYRFQFDLCRPSESRVRDVPWQTPPEALDQPVLIISHNHLKRLCNQVCGGILASGSLRVIISPFG